jgi:phosphatidylglycerol:prolipoprotein diacylglycerol transferase
LRQYLIEWGPFAVPSYGFFVAIAVVAGMHLSETRAQKSGYPKFLLLDALLIAFLAGLIGTKILYYIMGGEKGSSLFPTGYVRSIYGASISGFLAIFLFLKYKKAPMLKTMDIIFLYFPLSHAIGRIGCLCYGCCHGRICNLPFFSLQFPKITGYMGEAVGTPAFLEHLNRGLVSKDSSLSLPVYPTQVFAVISLLMIFIILRYLSEREFVISKPGFIFFLYCIFNGFERIIEEIFREHYRYFGLITKPQIVSILMIIAGILGMKHVLYKKTLPLTRAEKRRK